MKKLYMWTLMTALLLLPSQAIAWTGGGSSARSQEIEVNDSATATYVRTEEDRQGAPWEGDGLSSWVQKQEVLVETHIEESLLGCVKIISLQKEEEEIRGTLTSHFGLKGCCGPISATANLVGWINENNVIHLTITWRGYQSCRCDGPNGGWSWIATGEEEGISYQRSYMISEEGHLVPLGNPGWMTWNNQVVAFAKDYLPVPKSE